MARGVVATWCLPLWLPLTDRPIRSGGLVEVLTKTVSATSVRSASDGGYGTALTASTATERSCDFFADEGLKNLSADPSPSLARLGFLSQPRWRPSGTRRPSTTIGPHPARPVSAVAPHDSPTWADACGSAIGRAIPTWSRGWSRGHRQRQPTPTRCRYRAG
jgi:hypothetical protein